MPGVLSPDVYLRGDTGALRQTNGTTDAPVNGWLGGIVYSAVAASTAHSNTTTEALFSLQYSVPANTLVAGSVIKVRYQGIATATDSTDTLTIKLYIGGLLGTAILTGTATDVANNNIFAGEALIQIRTAGASGTLVAVGTHTEVPAASGTAVHDVTEITASTTIDTTAAQVIGVGADWSVATASNSCRSTSWWLKSIKGDLWATASPSIQHRPASRYRWRRRNTRRGWVSITTTCISRR